MSVHDAVTAPLNGTPIETTTETPGRKSKRAASDAAYITGGVLARRVGCNTSTVYNYRLGLPALTETGRPMYIEIRRKGGVGWMFAPEAEALMAAKYAARAEVKVQNAHAARAIHQARQTATTATATATTVVTDPALLTALADLTEAVRALHRELVSSPTAAEGTK